MKIHPNLTVIPGQKQGSPRRTGRQQSTPTFSLKESTTPESAPKKDVVEVVSLENKRALAPNPLPDLTSAEEALGRIKENLGNITKQDLAKVHRLEGLVHFYAT